MISEEDVEQLTYGNTDGPACKRSLRNLTYKYNLFTNRDTKTDVSLYLLSKSFFAACNSLCFFSSTFGYARSKDSSASTITVETTSRVNHLLSAGTTYHGACLVAVFRIMSSNAS